MRDCGGGGKRADVRVRNSKIISTLAQPSGPERSAVFQIISVDNQMHFAHSPSSTPQEIQSTKVPYASMNLRLYSRRCAGNVLHYHKSLGMKQL